MSLRFAMRSYLGISLLLFWILNSCPSSLLGATISLGELIASNGKLVSGDKEFSDFGYAATGNMPTADDVNVIPHENIHGDFGLRFQGAFLDVPDPHDASSDALITYRVKVTSPDRSLSGAEVVANLISRDGGTATVTETFLPIFAASDEVLRIPTTDDLLVDSVTFPRTERELLVQKNILMRATTSQVDMSFVDQTFRQVPEPHAILLFGFGLLVASRSRALRAPHQQLAS